MLASWSLFMATVLQACQIRYALSVAVHDKWTTHRRTEKIAAHNVTDHPIAGFIVRKLGRSDSIRILVIVAPFEYCVRLLEGLSVWAALRDLNIVIR